jgi:hypothetical protein
MDHDGYHSFRSKPEPEFLLPANQTSLPVPHVN